MQGMAGAVLWRGPGRRYQRLGQDLAAKNPLRPVARVEAAKDIFLDLFEVEQANQFRDGAAHPPI